MKLKHPSDRLRSFTELKKFSSMNSLKMSSQISKNSSQIRTSSLKKRNTEFIPFCQERDLGKLILNKNKLSSSRQKSSTNDDLVRMMSFKNFKKIYNLQKRIQQNKYAMKVRNSGQRNLIDQNQWIIKNVTKKTSLSLNSKLLSVDSTNTIRLNSHSTHLKGQKDNFYQQGHQIMSEIQQPPNQTFHKIDLQLYKKIALNRPPNEQNPQLKIFFKHYVQACQLNQNERRLFLTKKTK